MTARQVHFPVHDLAAAIHFYSAMFASAPVVLKSDCAKWMLNAPCVSFTIFTSEASRTATPGVEFFYRCRRRKSPAAGMAKMSVDFPIGCPRLRV
ncbi:MAG: VOC family protein [Thiobacillus sp.]